MFMMKLHGKFPWFIQHAVKRMYGKIPAPIRYGKVFRDTYAFLQKSQWWSREQLEEYQLEQLSKLLHHAYENVPYYKRVFNERGLKPKDIQDFKDLQQLPYLTKQIIRDNLEDLKARNYPLSKFQYETTGGSTGIPLGLYWEKGITEPKERAFVWRFWNWAGLKSGYKTVILRGNVIIKNGKSFWWDYGKENTLILSSYDMTEDNLFKYVEKINKFKPVAIRGYPSSLDILANFLRRNELELKGFKAILTSSENLYPWQRKLIEEYLGARIYDHYGNTERCVLAMQCEKAQYYHLIPEYGITELIGKDGKPVCSEGEIGEIVTTGFNNYAMPIIRYRTEDLGVYTGKKCECDRESPLLKRIEGRLQELIVAKDKRLITLTALIFAQHFNAFSKIKEMQLVQEEEGRLVVRIVKTGGYSDRDELEILQKMQRTVDDQLDITFNYIDEIPRTESGKHRFLIQKLPIKFGDP